MVYSRVNARGQRYYLHSREVELRNHRTQRIFFFAKKIKDGALNALPAGYEVVENKRTGLPVLRKRARVAANGS